MKNKQFNQYAFWKSLIVFNIIIDMDTNIPELLNHV